MILLQIIGNLGGDAEVQQVNNQTVIKFSVAHSYTYTNQQGQKVSSTTWVRCNYWVKSTGIAQYLTKGTTVYVSGEPRAHGWLAQDKKVAASLELRVDKVQLLGGKRDGNSNGNANVSQQESDLLSSAAGGADPDVNTITAPMDDLPF